MKHQLDQLMVEHRKLLSQIFDEIILIILSF